MASHETSAWWNLVSSVRLTVFSRGDECNPLVATADLAAFLTDAKLYTQEDVTRRRLTPKNVNYVWEGYDFKTQVRYLDEYRLSRYKWNSERLIDLESFLARPIVFLIVDNLNSISPVLQESAEPAGLGNPLRRKPETRMALEPYLACLWYAAKNRGCMRFYTRTDQHLIRDNDVLVYMGSNSKRICETFSDGFDVEVYRTKDWRKKMGV